jgi:hypothetical protein
MTRKPMRQRPPIRPGAKVPPAKRHVFTPRTMDEGDEDRGQTFSYVFPVQPGNERFLVSSLPSLSDLTPAIPVGVVPRLSYWRLKFVFTPTIAAGPVGVTTEASFWGAIERPAGVDGFPPISKFAVIGQRRLPDSGQVASTKIGVQFEKPYPVIPTWANLFVWYLHKTPGDELSWNRAPFTDGTIRIVEGELGLIY